MKIFHLLVNICRYLCEKWFSIGNENVKEEYVKYPHPELKRKLSRTRSITVYGYKPLLLSTFLSILFLFLSVIIAIGFSYLPLFIARLSSNRDLLTLNTSSSSTNKDSTTHSLSLLSTTHVFFPASSGKSYYEQHSPSEIYKQQNDLQIQQHEDQKYFSGGKPKKNISNDLRLEAETSLHLALRFVAEGKLDKARRLFEHSLTLDPLNSEILVEYGQFLEKHHNDLLQAEHYYSRALTTHPTHRRALENKRRCLPLVEEIDQKAFQFIDQLLTEFYRIPDTNPYLRRAKRDAYYLHIYHSNAIEGNTLNLRETRHIVETRMAIGGKSLQEQQEVLGLDLALQYVNCTLVNRLGSITKQDILEIHRRVLGFVDPLEAGQLRQHQVFVGSFTPPKHTDVELYLEEFLKWLNSDVDTRDLHAIELAALAHYRFVYIHPFIDGNGRTGRLLMNLILMRSGFPPVIIKKSERLAYYAYLDLANDGDIRPFIRFIAKCTERTLSEFIRYSQPTKGQEVSTQELLLSENSFDDGLGTDGSEERVIVV